MNEFVGWGRKVAQRRKMGGKSRVLFSDLVLRVNKIRK
jgi:hypothetical protein